MATSGTNQTVREHCDLYQSTCFTTCPAGYYFVINTGVQGINCEMCCKAPAAVNECQGSNNCHADATCTDTPASFQCDCNPGFSGDGVTCSDVDECALSPCHANATCINTPGSFNCQCNPGFTGDGINSCIQATIPFLLVLKFCPVGLRTWGIHKPARAQVRSDVNECATGADNCVDPSLGGLCTNTLGSFNCSCMPGYTGDGINNCNDINECTSGADNCDVNAMCNNTAGGFTCTCNAGYLGNGTYCIVDVNECATGADDCLDPSLGGLCTNTLGSWSCSCMPGYTGDGVNNCNDVNECSATPSPCGVSICNNTIGSYTCICQPGYQLNATTNTCEDIDECTSGAATGCAMHASCNNTVGSFTCACDLNYEGDGYLNCTLKQCGIAGPVARIVQGTAATDCRWGWSVSVRMNFSGAPTMYNNTVHMCSGVIIDMNWVLTSAACIKKIPGATFLVTSGTVNVNPGDDADPDMQQKTIAQVKYHPNFTSTDITTAEVAAQGFDATYPFDGNQFALLQVDSPFVFDTCTQAICLPEMHSECYSNTECFIAGWGANTEVINNNINFPNMPPLQEDQVTMMSKAACDVIRTAQGRYMPSADAEVCAVDNTIDIAKLQLPSRPCYGDAGSGFYCMAPDGYYHLQGIQLMEPAGYCTSPTLPYKVGDVTMAVDWIKTELGI
ncbi:latent-transforming growth factor beta-binding protein 1-like [Gigantopelta aegis]|uniref:latent-transforming growth factor beta-binding protein 1-like n=1 Tax=Gigantopelta aegis TaxID=1735272 RepID=UPI001B88D76D|nr:latent-transforming growth factor beta-binding protein 1-like [Gigantopelta aegis]